MKNKEKLKGALETFYGSEKALLSEISNALVKIETDIAEIDITTDKASGKHFALQKRKEFALKILSFFLSTQKAMESQQEYIMYLESIESDYNRVLDADTLMKKVATCSVAKHLIANGMSDADVKYCMNLKRA